MRAPSILSLLILSVLAAGCSPVEAVDVDARSPDADADVDGAVDAPVDAAAAPAPRVADSVADFSGEQGKGGWRYLYREPGGPLKELPRYDTGRWTVDFTKKWTSIGAESVHPDVRGKPDASGMFVNGGVQIPVRRWVSDVAGDAEIRYTAAKGGVGGDGVVVRIVVDDVQLAEHAIALDDTTGVTKVLRTPIGLRGNVDLIVEPGANESSDTTRISATITVR